MLDAKTGGKRVDPTGAMRAGYEWVLSIGAINAHRLENVPAGASSARGRDRATSTQRLMGVIFVPSMLRLAISPC